MQRRMKKPLTFIMALVMVLSLFGGKSLLVSAEDAQGNETALVIDAEETGVQTGSLEVTDPQSEVPEVTEAQEEASTEEAGQVPEESSETAVGTELVEYIPAKQPDGVSVKAYAGTGVLPEGTTMRVTMLEKDGETAAQYEEAAKALEESEVVYDGFQALDISFWDAEGNEIEPADGTVQVKFELASSLLPEAAAADTVQVQHLEETDAGIEVQTVADTGDVVEGAVVADEQSVKADFTVESFSTFTITWSGLLGSRTVTVKYVDQNGTALQGSQTSDVTLDMGKTVTLSDYALGLSDATYKGAHLGTVDGDPLTQIRAYWENGYQFKYTNDGMTWNDLENNATILLVYERESVTPPVEQEKQLAHDKYVEERQDGTYDLTLTIAGAVGSSESKTKLDVIYVLDVSGSMDYKISGTKKSVAAGNAINTMTNSLANNNKLDTRFALVTFSGSDRGTQPDATVKQGWTKNANDITGKSKPDSDGGTNYQAGIIEAKELLTTKRDGALTAVVFISDGNPTYRYGKTNNGQVDKSITEGSGSDDNGGYNLNAAKTELGNLSSNYFFTVGVGMKSEYDKLDQLITAATLVPQGNKKHYDGTDEEALKKAFDDIQSTITKLLCTDVTITDTLSGNVQIVTDASGQPSALTVRVIKDEDGSVAAKGENAVTFEGVTITASYDTNTKKITLDFPDDYQLKEGYTYQVTANIDATEKAYENYRTNNNSYPDTGDAATGDTSANQKGVFTNTSAEVTYTYNGKESTEKYPMPVIQLHPGTLTIEKTITGLENDENALNALKNQLTFEYQLNSGAAQTVSFSSFSYNEQSKKYTYEIAGLSPNTSYTVTEKNADISVQHAYNVKTTSHEASGTIGKDGKVTAAFTNAYEPSDHVLKVTKTVTGNMGDKTKEFAFTLTLKKGNDNYTAPLSYKKNGGTEQKLSANGDSYAFTLKDGESIELTIPHGCAYTITEDKEDYTASIKSNDESVTVEKATAKGTLSANTTIEYTNTKDIHTPTGLIHTMIPFVIMLAAGLGGAALLILRRRRRFF